MDDIRADEIGKFVDLALHFQEAGREQSYSFLILCLCSMIAELLAERVVIERDRH